MFRVLLDTQTICGKLLALTYGWYTHLKVENIFLLISYQCQIYLKKNDLTFNICFLIFAKFPLCVQSWDYDANIHFFVALSHLDLDVL